MNLSELAHSITNMSRSEAESLLMKIRHDRRQPKKKSKGKPRKQTRVGGKKPSRQKAANESFLITQMKEILGDVSTAEAVAFIEKQKEEKKK